MSAIMIREQGCNLVFRVPPTHGRHCERVNKVIMVPKNSVFYQTHEHDLPSTLQGRAGAQGTTDKLFQEEACFTMCRCL